MCIVTQWDVQSKQNVKVKLYLSMPQMHIRGLEAQFHFFFNLILGGIKLSQ